MTPSQSKSYEERVEKAANAYDVFQGKAVTFKAGVTWSNANPAPHILELVAALKKAEVAIADLGWNSSDPVCLIVREALNNYEEKVKNE